MKSSSKLWAGLTMPGLLLLCFLSTSCKKCVTCTYTSVDSVSTPGATICGNKRDIARYIETCESQAEKENGSCQCI